MKFKPSTLNLFCVNGKKAIDREKVEVAHMRPMKEIETKTSKSIPVDRLYYHRLPRKYYEGLAVTLAKTLGLRDPNLRFHSLEVANFATKLARQLG